MVDTSLFEAALQQTYWHAASYFATGESPGPTRLRAHPDRAVPGVPRERRLDVNIGGANQANWERIADVLGHPEWRDDPRFATNTARMANLRRADGRDERRARHANRARSGSRGSTRPACRRVRFTRSARR